VKKFLGFVAFLNDLLHNGPRAAKEFSHKVRAKALLRKDSGASCRATRKWFLASTLSRSLPWEVSELANSIAVASAVERWMGPRDVDPLLLVDLDEYMTRVLPIRPFNGEEPAWPMPNDKACLTHSTKEGGMAMALVEHRTAERLEQLDRLFLGIQEPDYREVLTSEFPAHEVEGLFEAFDEVADITEGRPSLPGPEVLRRYMSFRIESLRPVPIREMGGKIRVVTLHPAEEVLVARRITQLWLKQLRGFVVTRAMLRGEEVELRKQTEDSQIYSADLSAATDFIDHNLARRVARLLNARLGRSCDDPVTDKLFGPHRLPDGSETESGIHMGLGPTWIILSILNSFAAWRAGARKDTYRVCGDDLTGYWPSSVVDKYELTLERLGLVVNKSKSFFGPRGVFCEQIVEQCGGGKARARDVGHLSALTAAKLSGGFTHSALAVADGMESLRRIHPVVDQVRRGLAPRNVGTGRVRHGGNGFGTLSDQGLMNLIHRGPLKLVRDAPLPPKLLDGIEELKQGRVAIPDFLVELKSAIQATNYLKGTKVVTRPTSRKEFCFASRSNKSASRIVPERFREEIRGSQLSSANKKTALRLLKRGVPPPRSKGRRRLENVLSRPRAVRYIDPDKARAIIEANAPLGWKIKTAATE
jgi:hypothetical protein